MKPFDLIKLLVPALALAACASPSWYAQAISGHYGLMRDRVDIEEMLAAEDTDPELARELALAVEIREFAASTLGLADNESYRQFVRTGQDAVTWNVVAAPEFSLEPRRWCFLVSGCVSYRGYFERIDADEFGNKLAAEGWDVAVSPAVAYSTLGWFEDPLLDTMFRYSDEQLAAFIFHELAHQQLYVRGDTEFNEAYATFVEEAGVEIWLKTNERQDRLREWRQMQSASIQFNQLLLETRKRLDSLYRSQAADSEKRAGKEEAFRQLAESHQKLVRDEWSGQSYYSGWFENEPNNARLALANSYRGGVCAFTGLFESAGGDMERFHRLAAVKANASEQERSEWLSQPCGNIAPDPDL